MGSYLPSRNRSREPSRADGSLLSDDSQQVQASVTNEREILMDTQEWKRSPISNLATDVNRIDIIAQNKIYPVAFLPDGEHVVGGGWETKVRRWRVKDGKEVGKPQDAGTAIWDLAVGPQNYGKCQIVCGTHAGEVIVLDAISEEKVNKFKAHADLVAALDVSADGSKIATGSNDLTLSVWSLPAGERLLGPFKHFQEVVAVKFSHDDRFIATGTWDRESVRIYDSSNGNFLASFLVRVGSAYNGSLAWACHSNRLFALSKDAKIHCLDVPTNKTVAKWPIHSDDRPGCIAVTRNDTIIAASANSSISLWDTRTHQQIGTVLHRSHDIRSMAISLSYDIATAGDETITLRNLCDILPSPYREDILLEREMRHLKIKKPEVYDILRARDTRQKYEIANLEKTVQELRHWLATSNGEKTNLDETIKLLNSKDARQKNDIAILAKIVRELRDQLATSNKEKTGLNEMIKFLRSQNETLIRKITYLDESGKELRSALVASQGSANRLKQTFRTLRTDGDLPEKSSVSIAPKINELELTVQELGDRFATCECTLHMYDKKHKCETLYAHGRIYDAAQYISNMMAEDLKDNKLVIDWLKEFTHRCISRLQEIGDEASSSKKYDEALSAFSTILLLTPSPLEGVLTKWVRITLIRGSASEALGAIDKFKLTKFHVYRAVCNVLVEKDRLVEAVTYFRKMQNELSEETSTLNEQQQWELDFRQHCAEMLEKEGDTVMNAKNHDAAIGFYSNALSVHPTNISNIIVKCCKARVGLLEDKLINVTQNIERNPSDYNGYKMKHAILHSLGRYKEAFDAFEMMRSTMENSPDPQVQYMRGCYFDATPLIRQVVEQTISDIPRALINTTTGRLYDKGMQASAFEQHPIFNELRSFMTTRDRLDRARIQKEVKKFYEYVMFSHRWQPPEPSFQMVENAVVYRLPTSPTIDKLINFCKLVQSHRFRWAWSDTCCVNQSDRGVQQESVVAMFQWYCHAALTIVHLLGVFSESQEPGSLWKSIWNTRGWTYQEYVASKVIQFYTEDWKPYLGLEMFNHKESPVILKEMEQATNFATEALATLQPGLTRVREKLYLASKRQTTRREDAAYSLFGIFSVTLPVIYGEGNQAVGHLLEHILTRSDNVTILAWTGMSSSNHSYLPLDLTVYNQVVPPHVPQPIDTAEIDSAVKALQSSLPDPSLSSRLYEQLLKLPLLSLVAGRLRLSGLVFPLHNVERLPERSPDTFLPVYHATTPALGDVRIETKDYLAGMKGLVLIHPWIAPLIDEDFWGISPRFDLAVRALRLVVRLRQPFGALLLAPQNRVQYKRVATDSFINVRIRAETPLGELMDNVRTVDVQ